MFKKYKHIFDNKFILIAGLLALFLSPIEDAIGGNAPWALSLILIPLFFYGLFDENKKFNKLNSDIVHIPLVINVKGDPEQRYVMKDLLAVIEKEYEIDDYSEELNKYLGVNTDNLIFNFKGNIYNFDELMSFLRIIKYKKAQLETKLNKRVTYHIAYYKRPAIGFLVGGLFRTDSIIVYQNNDSKNSFEKVAHVIDRNYKERLDKFEKYNIEYLLNNNTSDDVLLTIRSSSHNINFNTDSLKDFKNIVKIDLIEGNTIPYDSDWIEYSKEIYNVINELQTKYKTITIVHAMPEALAVLLGMALENYWNIKMTQFEHKESNYKYVFSMNNVEYYD